MPEISTRSVLNHSRLTTKVHSTNGNGQNQGDGDLRHPSVLQFRSKHDEHDVERNDHGTTRDDD